MVVEIKKTSARAWSMLGQRGAIFSTLMPELAGRNENIRLVTADLSLLSGMERYIRDYPEQFLNVGIAEQNMIGIAAGMAMEGRRVFATTYASFIAVRALEHVRQHLGHLKCDVKLIGSSAGVVASKSGISHWATEDIAFIRAIPGIEIYSPADAMEAMKVVEYAATHEGPMYIRLTGSVNCPVVYKNDYEWEPGKNIVVRRFSDEEVKAEDTEIIAEKQTEKQTEKQSDSDSAIINNRIIILATGMMVAESIKAAKALSEQGIEAEVVDVHSIRPFDEEYLAGTVGRVRNIFTVEEHSIRGGLGGAVAEVLSGIEGAPKLTRIGIDEYMDKLGSYEYVLKMQGLTAEGIARKVAECVKM